MRAVSLSNKMGFSAGSLSLPQPSQIFMVGSITWVINADGVGELLEPVQIRSAPTTLAPATVDPILEPLLRSTSSATQHSLPRYRRRHVNNDDLIESIDRVGLKLADCLSIAELALDTLVQQRSPSNPDLSVSSAQQTSGLTALPFGLANTTATYQDALKGKFANQVGDTHPLADQSLISSRQQSTCCMQAEAPEHPSEPSRRRI